MLPLLPLLVRPRLGGEGGGWTRLSHLGIARTLVSKYLRKKVTSEKLWGGFQEIFVKASLGKTLGAFQQGLLKAFSAKLQSGK